jgi:multidrug efflux pump subunit AcrB
VKLNNSPEAEIDELNDLPIKTVNGATIYMRDVAHVRDGYPAAANVVRVDGAASVLMTVLKSGRPRPLDRRRRQGAAAEDPGTACRRR